MSSILKAGLPTVQPRPPLKYATAAAAVTPSASQQGNVSTPATAPSLLGAGEFCLVTSLVLWTTHDADAESVTVNIMGASDHVDCYLFNLCSLHIPRLRPLYR